MSDYIKWNEKTLETFTEEEIEKSYSEGFVFTRKFKGSMEQTRSIRIDLSKFTLSSENRRILRKNENLKLEIKEIPLTDYNYNIHLLAKKFYSEKFGPKVMSANKIKELVATDKNNFNKLFIYSLNGKEVGYCITLVSANIVHYSYPFYQLEYEKESFGIGMMTMAINWAKESGKKYIYLGSFKDSSSKYKLQFEGLEWFDSKDWRTDIEELKDID